MPKRRITAGGEIVEVDEEAPAKDIPSSAAPAPGVGEAGEERYNIFGFSLDRKQLFLAAIFAFFFFSLRGILIMIMIHMASRLIANRRANPSTGFGFGSNTSSPSPGGRALGRMQRTTGRSNVHGISDLPTEPRRG